MYGYENRGEWNHEKETTLVAGKKAEKWAYERVSEQARVQERACNTINLTILRTIVFSDASDEFSLLGKLLVIIESCLPQSFGCSMLVLVFSMWSARNVLPEFPFSSISTFLLFCFSVVVCFFTCVIFSFYKLHAPFTQCKHLPRKRKGQTYI